MKGLKDTWVGFLAVFVLLSISSGFIIRAIQEKADKKYVDSQIQLVIISVSAPLKEITCKLDTIIKYNKNERE
jgi:hypothetical protein